jgi:hypothetical protein
MTLKPVSAAALAGAVALSALTPVAAWASPVRLAVAGAKGDTVVMLDMGSRRNAQTKVEADALLIFRPANPDFLVTQEDGQPPEVPPDHGRITLQFDCKARNITLVRMTLLGADGAVMKATEPAPDPQPAVDPTDAHLLAFACGETFPDKTFADEKSAIAAARATP